VMFVSLGFTGQYEFLRARSAFFEGEAHLNGWSDMIAGAGNHQRRTSYSLVAAPVLDQAVVGRLVPFAHPARHLVKQALVNLSDGVLQHQLNGAASYRFGIVQNAIDGRLNPASERGKLGRSRLQRQN